MKTKTLKKAEVKREWYVVDAKDKILGRLASKIAVILIGKHKPQYTPHVDCGDYVVVLNADKFRVTGAKMKGKLYRTHSMYPGGLKSIDLETMLKKHHAMPVFQFDRIYRYELSLPLLTQGDYCYCSFLWHY